MFSFVPFSLHHVDKAHLAVRTSSPYAHLLYLGLARLSGPIAGAFRGSFRSPIDRSREMLAINGQEQLLNGNCTAECFSRDPNRKHTNCTKNCTKSIICRSIHSHTGHRQCLKCFGQRPAVACSWAIASGVMVAPPAGAAGAWKIERRVAAHRISGTKRTEVIYNII